MRLRLKPNTNTPTGAAATPKTAISATTPLRELSSTPAAPSPNGVVSAKPAGDSDRAAEYSRSDGGGVNSQSPMAAATAGTTLLAQTVDEALSGKSAYELLTNEQREAVDEVLEWMKVPPNYADLSTIVSTFKGAAGTGKSFSARAIVERSGHSKVLGLAPVHVAVNNLADAVGIPCRTLPSYLCMTMEKVSFTVGDKHELKSLNETIATGLSPLSEQESSRHALLEYKERASKLRIKALTPRIGPESMVSNYSFLIVDEAWMVDKSTYNYLLDLVALNASPDVVTPKILLMGDDKQLPPIGETLSQASAFSTLSELTTPVRQKDENLAQFVAAARELTDPSEISHSFRPFLKKSPGVVRVDPVKALYSFHGDAKERGYRNVRILTTTNQRVMEINDDLFRRLNRPEDRPYYEKDLLITRGAVVRDPDFPSVPGASEGNIIFSTSTPIVVDKVLTGISSPMPCGANLRTFNIVASCGPVTEEALVIHPLDMQKWDGIKTEYKDAALSTKTKSRASRGQKGDKAKRAWRIWGLKNWGKCVDLDKVADESERARILKNWSKWRRESKHSVCLSSGAEISDKDYRFICGRLWSEFYATLQVADNIRFCFCTTVHGAQCQTIKKVVIDFPAFIPSGGNKGYSDWPHLQSYYTAVSRASEVLEFMY